MKLISGIATTASPGEKCVSLLFKYSVLVREVHHPLMWYDISNRCPSPVLHNSSSTLEKLILGISKQKPRWPWLGYRTEIQPIIFR